MKKITIVVAVFALAVLIVLPVMRSVNLSGGKPVTTDRVLIADGWPLPPGPPMPPSTLVADGWPLPPGPPMPPTTFAIDGVLIQSGPQQLG